MENKVDLKKLERLVDEALERDFPEQTKLQFVTFEQAKRLETAGFDYATKYVYFEDGERGTRSAMYVNSTLASMYVAAAPETALALKWMRDVKGVNYCQDLGNYRGHKFWAFRYETEYLWTGWEETYEQAESALLDELLTMIENENN